MIVLRTPKGWTAPREVDGHRVEGFWGAHQVPIGDVESNSAHLKLLEDWVRGCKPEELFGASGGPMVELRALAPMATAAWARIRMPTAACRARHCDCRIY